MIEQIGMALPFTAFYTTLGIGTTGLTVTVDVYRNGTEIVAAEVCADAGDGLYTYTLAAGSNDAEGVYVAVFKTATTTVDQQHLPAAWYVGKAGVENLDASIAAVPTAPEIDTQLSGVHGAGLWGSGTGGSLTLTYTVNVTGGGVHSGSIVELYSDSGRTTFIDTQVSNVLGQAFFYNLVAGTYYIKVITPGYETLLDSEVVA